MKGRPPKQGIDYAGWDVTIFDADPKIDKLLDAQGWQGFGIYFYLCQRAYGLNGYYLEWSSDDAPSTARKMGGKVGSQTVIDTVNLCFNAGLFDKASFEQHGILTSRGIQRRFREVAIRRTFRVVIREYWLLADAESEGFVFHTLHSDFTAQKMNYGLQKMNYDPPKMNYGAIKESKVKESKVYDNNAAVVYGSAPPAENTAATATEQDLIRHYLNHIQSNAHKTELDKICSWLDTFPADVIMLAIDEAVRHNSRRRSYIEGILRDWEKAGLLTSSLVQGHFKAWEERKSKLPQPGSRQKSRFASSNRHNYNYAELERLTAEYIDKQLEGGV